jgi:catechol 2,3-dioxygenase-like lactoylglutathione lyase family enzyme
MLSGVQDVYYNVADMDRAVAFYEDRLGMRLVDRNPHWAAFDLGGVRIGLHWTGGSAVPRVPRDAHGAHTGATLTLRTQEIARLHQKLTEVGVRFLSEPTAHPWGTHAVFEDPDGNVLKLMQPAGIRSI